MSTCGKAVLLNWLLTRRPSAMTSRLRWRTAKRSRPNRGGLLEAPRSCWFSSCRCAAVWVEGQLRAGGHDRVPVVPHRDELTCGPGFVLIGVVRARRISRCTADDDPPAVVPATNVEYVT